MAKIFKTDWPNEGKRYVVGRKSYSREEFIGTFLQKNMLNTNQREVTLLTEFVRLCFIRTKTQSKRNTYGFKHDAEKALGFYVSNEDMKLAFLDVGFVCQDGGGVNPNWTVAARYDTFPFFATAGYLRRFAEVFHKYMTEEAENGEQSETCEPAES